MICSKCGYKNDKKISNCVNCGNELSEQKNVKNSVSDNSKKTYKLKEVFLISSLILIIVLICLITFLHHSVLKRTVMVYMVGSDLESEFGLATSNLNDMIKSNIDYKNIDVVLCVGGTKEWKNNDISVSETSYFKIEDGFLVKIKKQEAIDMGNESTLTNFLDFVYDNYNSNEYYLMFWNHGGALDGLEYDELTDNNLSLNLLDISLKSSKFNINGKKIDMVLLNNCLMGSLETASILSKYADYMVASEDVIYASTILNPLSFLGDVKPSESTINIGKKYIDIYANGMKDNFSDGYVTMSLIDLSKIDDIISYLNSFFNEIKLDNKISRQILNIRYNTYEYQARDDFFDMVDLSNFVINLESINSNNKNLLNSIDKSIVYSVITDPYSKGLSIYFPESHDWREIYETIDFSADYIKFMDEYINSINSRKINMSSISGSNINKVEDSKFTLQLSNEQVEAYKDSKFTIFQKIDDKYYKYIMMSDDTSIDENGLITANYDGEAIVILDDANDTGKYGYLQLFEVEKNDLYVLYDVLIDLVKYKSNGNINWDGSKIGYQRIKVMKDGHIIPQEIYIETGKNNSSATSDIIANLDDFDEITYYHFAYDFFDDVGNFNVNYKSNQTYYGSRFKIGEEEFSFSKIKLDSEKEYYGMITVDDIYGNRYCSKAIKIN